MSKTKYNLIFIASAIFIVGLISTLALSHRKGTYSVGEPVVTITCPAAVANGATSVACTVALSDLSNYTVMSVNANYAFGENDLDGNVSFSAAASCSGHDCFQQFVSTNSGFAVVNTEGTTQNATIGTMTFDLTETNGNSYTVGLDDIEICIDNSGNYEMLSLADATTTIRVYNNVATLDNITLYNRTPVSESFNSNNKTYTATVADNYSTDSVSLVLTKTDNNATISGVTTNLNLHYGTNNYSITVTAEDGQTEETYNITIIREFDFTPYKEGYTYNSSDNYIYIKNEPSNTLTSNLGTLPTNMTYNVNNNKLEVKYANEILKNIDILRFDSDYQIIGNNIYIDSGLTLGTLKTKLTGSSVTFKYYSNNVEVTDNSATVSGNYTIKVFYNNVELDNYEVIIDHLTFDNSLVIDNNKKIIKRLPIGTTYGDLKALIDTNGIISLTTVDNITVDDEYNLRTGDTLSIGLLSGTETYTISIVGCLDDTSSVTLGDVILLYRYLKHRVTFNDTELAAADINNNGNVGLDDVILLYRYLKGRINSLEVE